MDKQRLTARISIALTPDLKHRLEMEAKWQHRSIASTMRELLADALDFDETPTNGKEGYFIFLTDEEAYLLDRDKNITPSERYPPPVL